MFELNAEVPDAPMTVGHPGKKWMFRLYVAGQTFGSILARSNLHEICEQLLADEYYIEVIDLLENPKLAKLDQIIAIPTLVRKAPVPTRRIIGDLSNTERVLFCMDIHPKTL